jgi:hypothetical protein
LVDAERALAIDEAAYGPDHPAVATDLNNLAQILQDLGQPGAARDVDQRASWPEAVQEITGRTIATVLQHTRARRANPYPVANGRHRMSD